MNFASVVPVNCQICNVGEYSPCGRNGGGTDVKICEVTGHLSSTFNLARRKTLTSATRHWTDKDYYTNSPNIVRVIKSRRMRWVGHVARMGEEREAYGSWWGNRRETDHWGDLGVDGWIIYGSPGGGMWVCGLDWTGPG